MTKPDWIAVDWGPTHLRAYAVGRDGSILNRAHAATGLNGLTKDELEPALIRLIEPWLSDATTPVLACGLLGAKQGWADEPYRATPCRPDMARPTTPPTTDLRIALHLLPGVGQNQPADVLHGEDMQAAGVIAENPQFDGVLCLPGAYTKWIHISAEEIVSFQTAMTGELFALLAEHSILHDAVSAKDLDHEAFDAAVDQMLSRPERLAQALFSIHAEGALRGLNAAQARGRLLGLLIGAEIASMRPYWLGQQVLIGGDAHLVPLYARALAAQGVPINTRDAEFLTLAGMSLVWKTLSQTKH